MTPRHSLLNHMGNCSLKTISPLLWFNNIQEWFDWAMRFRSSTIPLMESMCLIQTIHFRILEEYFHNLDLINTHLKLCKNCTWDPSKCGLFSGALEAWWTFGGHRKIWDSQLSPPPRGFGELESEDRIWW